MRARAVAVLSCWVVPLTLSAGPARQPAVPPPDDTRPVVVSDRALAVDADPLRPPIRGDVVLDAVIDPGGRVGDVAVVRSLDGATDRAAVAALKSWQFRPATHLGQPVPARARFTYALGAGSGGSVQASSPDVVFEVGDGTVAPRLRHEVKPAYPGAARDAGVSGVVLLTCVVLTDGTASEIRVRRSLEPSLDQAAMAALRGWTFEPGRRAGAPVPVQVEVEMSFATK